MGVLFYTRPSDNVLGDLLDSAFSVESGGEDAGFPAENLGDLNVAKPAKLTNPTGRWEFDLGSAIAIDVVALIHHNLDAGITVKVQANTVAATWGAPPLDETIVIPALTLDRHSVNPFKDLTGVSPRTFRFWAIQIATANAFNPTIGEVVLASSFRSFAKNFQRPLTESEFHPVTEQGTDLGVPWLYGYGSAWRTTQARFLTATSQDFTDFRNLVRDARGRELAFLQVTDLAINDAQWVRFQGASMNANRTRISQLIDEFAFLTEEVSRGVSLYDPTQ